MSSFACYSCGDRNSSIQPATGYGDRGVRYTLAVNTAADLNRQVIKSEWGTVRVPAIQLEIPPETQKGLSSTVEGFLTKTRDGLLDNQESRREQHPEIAGQIDTFIANLNTLLDLDSPFTFQVEDPTGNSFVENMLAPVVDPQLKVEHYVRSEDDEEKLGITVMKEAAASDAAERAAEKAADSSIQEKDEEGEKEEKEVEEQTKVTQNEHSEVITFPTSCNACGHDAECNMKEVNIPFFKNVILMANVCANCGFRDCEVKSGGGIGDKGNKITLNITDSDMDLSRDILKTETTSVHIPELDLELTGSTLGGRFTTIEGLLEQIKDNLTQLNPFSFGDSATGHLAKTVRDLDDVLQNERLVTLILDDPAGNCYIQNMYAPDPDPNLTIEFYERTEEQNDELGILHMKTDNYNEQVNTKEEGTKNGDGS